MMISFDSMPKQPDAGLVQSSAFLTLSRPHTACSVYDLAPVRSLIIRTCHGHMLRLETFAAQHLVGTAATVNHDILC